MTAHLLPLDGLGLIVLLGLAFATVAALAALVAGGQADDRLEEWRPRPRAVPDARPYDWERDGR